MLQVKFFFFFWRGFLFNHLFIDPVLFTHVSEQPEPTLPRVDEAVNNACNHLLSGFIVPNLSI